VHRDGPRSPRSDQALDADAWVLAGVNWRCAAAPLSAARGHLAELRGVASIGAANVPHARASSTQLPLTPCRRSCASAVGAVRRNPTGSRRSCALHAFRRLSSPAQRRRRRRGVHCAAEAVPSRGSNPAPRTQGGKTGGSSIASAIPACPRACRRSRTAGGLVTAASPPRREVEQKLEAAHRPLSPEQCSPGRPPASNQKTSCAH
jgi:hypothetical protein